MKDQCWVTVIVRCYQSSLYTALVWAMLVAPAVCTFQHSVLVIHRLKQNCMLKQCHQCHNELSCYSVPRKVSEKHWKGFFDSMPTYNIKQAVQYSSYWWYIFLQACMSERLIEHATGSSIFWNHAVLWVFIQQELFTLKITVWQSQTLYQCSYALGMPINNLKEAGS